MDASKVKKKSTGMHKSHCCVAPLDLRSARARREAAKAMARLPEIVEDDDDDEEVAPPPDEPDAFDEHGDDEPGAGSPPGIIWQF